MYLCETLEGKVQVPYLNWNGDKRKLNANWSDNDWNGKGRLLFVRNLISFKGATEGRLFVFFTGVDILKGSFPRNISDCEELQKEEQQDEKD